MKMIKYYAEKKIYNVYTFNLNKIDIAFEIIKCINEIYYYKNNILIYNMFYSLYNAPIKMQKIMLLKWINLFKSPGCKMKYLTPSFDNIFLPYLNDLFFYKWEAIILNSLPNPYKIHQQTFLSRFKYITHFNIFKYIYDGIYLSPFKVKMKWEKEHDKKHKYYIRLPLNNKDSIMFFKYYLLNLCYRNIYNLKHMSLHFYIKNEDSYYHREFKLIDYSFKPPYENSIEVFIKKFNLKWKALNLAEYYDLYDQESSFFTITVNLKNTTEKPIMKSLIIPRYNIEPSIKKREVITFDFNIIN